VAVLASPKDPQDLAKAIVVTARRTTMSADMQDAARRSGRPLYSASQVMTTRGRPVV
jgi:hypothetical protein